MDPSATGVAVVAGRRRFPARLVALRRRPRLSAGRCVVVSLRCPHRALAQCLFTLHFRGALLLHLLLALHCRGALLLRLHFRLTLLLDAHLLLLFGGTLLRLHFGLPLLLRTDFRLWVIGGWLRPLDRPHGGQRARLWGCGSERILPLRFGCGPALRWFRRAYHRRAGQSALRVGKASRGQFARVQRRLTRRLAGRGNRVHRVLEW